MRPITFWIAAGQLAHATEPHHYMTASRGRSLRACARKHLFEYVLGFRPVAAAHALTFGHAAHAGLEAWWLADGGEGRLDAALAAIDAAPGLDPFDRAKAEVMLAGYDAVWRDELHRTLAVEREFTLPLVSANTGAPMARWSLAGKLDAVAELADGRVAIVEHKTAGESVDVGAGSDYRQRLTLDGQVSQYFEGAATLGFDADVCVYDVLVKPAMRPLLATPADKLRWTKGKPATRNKPAEPPRLCAGQRAEDEGLEDFRARVADAIAAEPERFYSRHEVVRLDGERDAFAFDVWQLATLVDVTLGAGLAPMNPEACHRYGSRCAFWPVCSGTADLEDPSLYRRAASAHEELSLNTAAPANDVGARHDAA